MRTMAICTVAADRFLQKESRFGMDGATHTRTEKSSVIDSFPEAVAARERNAPPFLSTGSFILRIRGNHLARRLEHALKSPVAASAGYSRSRHPFIARPSADQTPYKGKVEARESPIKPIPRNLSPVCLLPNPQPHKVGDVESA